MWRRFIAWLLERDTPAMTTPAQAPPDQAPPADERAMTVPEIDTVLRHWTAKLGHAKDDKQHQQWMNVIDRWLEARHRLVHTQALEKLYREKQ